jgi:subtilisin family serine protease
VPEASAYHGEWRPPEDPKTFEDTQWWVEKLSIRRMHRTSTGDGVKIGLVDQPVDTSVPELQGADIRMGVDCAGRVARPWTGGSTHGTQLATLVVGNGRGTLPDGSGILGIAPDATLISYVDDMDLDRPEKQCSVHSVDRVVRDAIRRGVDILSVSSAGTTGSTAKAYLRAMKAGIVVVGATGDERDSIAYPADLPGAVSVAAVDHRGLFWDKHRSGGVPPIISAPGVNLGTGDNLPDGRWTSFGWATGTSGATALVSGALALVKSEYPRSTRNQLAQHLIHYTAGDEPFQYYDDYGFGILSVREMLATSPRQWPDEDPLQDVDETLRDYPMQVSSLVPDASPSPQSGPVADATPVGPSDNPSAGPGDAEETQAAGAAQRGGGDGGSAAADGTLPAWSWPVLAVAVLGAGLVGARGLLRRRRSTSTATTSGERG